jgi:tRNA A22 N-methylase
MKFTEQILKYQFKHDQQAFEAAQLLEQITHVRQGNTITVHIAQPEQLHAVINALAGLGAHTISDISDHDLRELWKVIEPSRSKFFYFDQLV